MALPVGTKAGPVWRVAPGGTVQVYYSGTYGVHPDGVPVYGQGQRQPWAKRPMRVPMADLFLNRSEAREEFRRRKAERAEVDAIAERHNREGGPALLRQLFKL